MGKEYVIKIVGWKKYQNREVKTRSIWLRFQNDFIENPNFGEFSSDERVTWIYALCCASKLNTDTLQVPHQCSHRVLHRCTGIDEKTFHRTFEKLKKLRAIEIRTTRGRYADDTSENADDTLRDETRRDGDETRQDDSVRGETAVAVADPKAVALESKKLAKVEAGKKAQAFAGAYVKAYQTRFPEGRPEDLRDGKVRGQILAWIADYDLERACQLIQVYFQMETKWFGAKGYDFLTFRNNLNKIGQALDSGHDPDGNQINWAKLERELGA